MEMQQFYSTFKWLKALPFQAFIFYFLSALIKYDMLKQAINILESPSGLNNFDRIFAFFRNSSNKMFFF